MNQHVTETSWIINPLHHSRNFSKRPFLTSQSFYQSTWYYSYQRTYLTSFIYLFIVDLQPNPEICVRFSLPPGTFLEQSSQLRLLTSLARCVGVCLTNQVYLGNGQLSFVLFFLFSYFILLFYFISFHFISFLFFLFYFILFCFFFF